MTVVRRIVRSSPHRDTLATWDTIVELLTRGEAGPKRDELMSVRNVASAVIAERSPDAAPIVVVCDGPRTRIYCRYDECAIEGSDVEEDPLTFDPLKGDWRLSLPAPEEDLDWVRKELKKRSTRISARDMTEKVSDADAPASSASANAFIIDEEAFKAL